MPRLQPSVLRGGYWIVILPHPVAPRLDEWNKITGKYLFFSTNRERLIEIAINEIEKHRFPRAKVNSKLLGTNKEYVLCLYYADDSRKLERSKRAKDEYPDVNYRDWKDNADTRSGKYSEEFLSKLSDQQRKQFTQK